MLQWYFVRLQNPSYFICTYKYQQLALARPDSSTRAWSDVPFALCTDRQREERSYWTLGESGQGWPDASDREKCSLDLSGSWSDTRLEWVQLGDHRVRSEGDEHAQISRWLPTITFKRPRHMVVLGWPDASGAPYSAFGQCTDNRLRGPMGMLSVGAL
jgi:hypothetical protein